MLNKYLGIFLSSKYYRNLLGNYVNMQSHQYIKLINKRHNSFRCNYSNDLEAAVNEQIKREKQAAEAYLKLAVKFLHPSVAYMGTGGFFMKMYDEELGHLKQLVNYQLMRGGTPILNCQTDTKVTTLYSAYNEALNMEIEITKQLQEVVCVAETNRDNQCADYVCSKFLEEQMHTINELAQHVTTLSRLGNDEHAMYHFDKQMAKLYPYSLK